MNWNKRILSLLLAAAVVGGSWSVLGGNYALADDEEESVETITPAETPEPAVAPQPATTPTPATPPAAEGGSGDNGGSGGNDGAADNTEDSNDQQDNNQQQDPLTDPSSKNNNTEEQNQRSTTAEEQKSDKENTDSQKAPIAFTQNSISLPVGQTYNLATLLSGSAAETWESDNPAKASVAAGTVTANAVGRATITATNADGNSATIVVFITEPTEAPEPVQTIQLNKSSFLLYVDGTFTMTATVTPVGTAVTWTSRDAKIATVKDGVVTGKKPGKTTITATTEGGVSASCDVTVVERPDGSGKTSTVTTPGASYRSGFGWYSSLFGNGSLFNGLTSKYTMPTNIPDHVILTFDGSLNKNVETILDAMYLYDSFGTFFVKPDDIYTKDDRVRRIVGEGHAIGITLTEKDLVSAGTALHTLEQANRKLSTVCGVPTRLVSIQGGSRSKLSKSMYHVLRKNGYRVWDWDYKVDETETTQKASEALEKQLDTTGRIVVRLNTRKRSVSTLQEVLGYMNYASMPTQALVDSDKPVCQMKKSNGSKT